MHLIPKFQQGGGFAQFMTEYKPVQLQQSTQATSARAAASDDSTTKSKSKGSSDGDKSVKLTESQFLAMVKDLDGLPNEIGSISTQVTKLFQDRKLLGDDYVDLASEYAKIKERLILAKFNKEKYDNAYKTAEAKGSFSEYAIAGNGEVVVQGADGKLSTVGVDKLMANPQAYTPISVSQLMNLRAFSPETAGNQEIFSIVSNSVGFEDFTGVMSKLALQLGHSEQSIEGVVTVKDGSIQGQGMQVLDALKNDPRVASITSSISLDGLYKYNLINTTQKSQIQSLLNYAVTIMPTRIKTWASLKTGIGNKNEAAQKLVLNYLLGRETPKSEVKLDYSPLKKDDGSGSGSGSGGGKKKDYDVDEGISATWLTNVISSKGGRDTMAKFDMGNGAQMTLKGTYYSGLGDKKTNSPVNNFNLKSVLNNTGLLQASAGGIYFGKKLLHDVDMLNVAVVENGGTRVNLPATKDQSGNIVPDFQALSQFQAIINKINSWDIKDHDTREKVIKKLVYESGNKKLVDAYEGNVDSQDTYPFFITTGVVRKDDMPLEDGEDPKDLWMTLNDEDSKNHQQYINNVQKYTDYGLKEKVDEDDEVYVSTIMIPLNPNRLTAVTASGQKPKESDAKSLEEEYQHFNTREADKKAGVAVKGTGIDALNK